MNVRTSLVLAALTTSVVCNTGCWWKKAKAAPPPAVITTPRPPPPEPIPPAPSVAASPSVTELPPLPTGGELSEPARPEPPPAPPKAARTSPPPTEPATTPVEAPEPSVPKLVQLLSKEEQDRHNREIDEFVRRAEENLSRIGHRRLSAQQQRDVERTRAFLRQAQELRGTDLLTARSLAQRADALADSVARTVR